MISDCCEEYFRIQNDLINVALNPFDKYNFFIQVAVGNFVI